MKVFEFLEILQKNKEKEVLFKYKKEHFIGANYLLTEIKNVDFTTVDCGGKQNSWQETQMQLWESPREINRRNYLTTDKFLAIFNRVNSIVPIWLKTELKVEFGNENFHTSVMKISSYTISATKIVIQLFIEKTQCKAILETEITCC